jgi:hypothetical protein
LRKLDQLAFVGKPQTIGGGADAAGGQMARGNLLRAI